MRRLRLSSAPVFLQVLGLVLVSLAAASVINTWVVLNLPAPPPAGLTVAEAARALGGETVTAANGERLRVRVLDHPPSFGGPDAHDDRVEAMIAQALVRELGVAPEALKVDLRLDPAMRRKTMGWIHAREARRMMLRDERREVTIHLRSGAPGGPAGPAPETVELAHALHGRGVAVFSHRLMFPPFAAALRGSDGRWTVVEPAAPFLSAWQKHMLLGFGLSALLTAPLAFLLARRLTRPIGAFADAAERLGRDPKAPPMAAEGPAEVRAAAAAFNDMQDKLRAYLEERTAMIAAIAHDLRTPLMRLRFRVEAAPDEAREKMAADIAEMDGMISQALAFVRGETVQDARLPLELAALAAAVVDDLAETGVAASLTAAELAAVLGDPVGLKRMLTNLVENAVKFGGAARVRLTVEDGWAVLVVEDDGPGLPEAELERVFEPFHRAEPSRSRDTGGVGLGLAVARSIARAHGGDIRLANRTEGGLTATATLPLA